MQLHRNPHSNYKIMFRYGQWRSYGGQKILNNTNSRNLIDQHI